MKTLLLDIETAPHKVYAWGLYDQTVPINNIVEQGYTLCWAAKWLGDKKKDVMFSSRYDDTERTMIKKIHKLIDEADVVVHYNGTKFDMPILNQEFLKLGLTPPSPVIEVDLLKTFRKKFRMPSNKLDYVSRYLGLAGKLSHKGMSLWLGCMEGDPRSWNTMRRYNIQDVNLLEEVYERLLPWIHNHPNRALFTSEEGPVCPKCGKSHLQKRGKRYTQTQVYQQYRCMDCGSWSRARATILTPEKRKNLLVN